MEHYLSTDSRELFSLCHHDVCERLTVIYTWNSVVFSEDIIFFEDIVDEDCPDSFDLTSLRLTHVDLFLIFLILDIAEYFFEDIFHRHDSCSPTVFIDDQCDMTTRLLKSLEEIIEWAAR